MMFVRKSKISQLIKKEKENERKKCEKENNLKFVNAVKNLEEEHDKICKVLKKEHKQVVLKHERKILNLQREIESNYLIYRELRKREKSLDLLSSEIEDVTEVMMLKVQESLQPFFRARAKVEITKRKADKRHEKVESIFRAVK